MGVKTNAMQTANKFHAMARALPTAEKAGVTAGARIMKDTILDAARAQRWHPKSGWVRYDLRPGATPAATVTLRGARAHWAEQGTKAHDIQPKKRRGRGKKAILTPEGPRASARHPGTKGRPFWHRGVNTGAPLVADASRQAVVKTLRSIF